MNMSDLKKQDSFRALMLGIYDRLQDHGHCGPHIVLAPSGDDGKPDWSHATPANIQPLGGDWPDDASTLHRVAVLIDDIDGCDPETSLLLYIRADGEPCLEQIAGHPDDAEIAMRIVGRDIGAKPVDCTPFSIAEPAKRLSSDLSRPKAANDNAVHVDLPAMHPAPFTPEAAGGLLSDIAKWITSTAIVPVPELSLASAIALLAGIFGKVALTPTRAGINVYLTTLLGTAGGKGWPAKAIRALSDQPGTAGAVTNGDPTSFAAMERILRKNSSTVVVFDEFGITLQDVNATHKNSVAAGIRKFLLAIYDQANSVFDGRIYANAETKKDEAPLVGPALTVLGMTTIDTLYAGLSQASIADGFLNRFMFITSTPHDGPIVPPKLDSQTKPPKHLKEALASAKSVFPGGMNKTVVPMDGGEDGEAYRRWGQIFVWQQLSQSELAGRAAENSIRLATIRAISRNPANPSVRVDDVEWGWAIVYSSLCLVEDGVSKYMAASPAEALRKAILAVIETAPNGIPYSKLLTRKGVSGANSRDLFDALIWLISSEQIEDLSTNKHPGSGSKFRSKMA